jgi:hypothetical protein
MIALEPPVRAKRHFSGEVFVVIRARIVIPKRQVFISCGILQY